MAEPAFLHQRNAGLDIAGRFRQQRGNFPGSIGGALRQLAHFLRDNGKACRFRRRGRLPHRHLSARRFVWKAISSITPMIWLIFCEET